MLFTLAAISYYPATTCILNSLPAKLRAIPSLTIAKPQELPFWLGFSLTVLDQKFYFISVFEYYLI